MERFFGSIAIVMIFGLICKASDQDEQPPTIFPVDQGKDKDTVEQAPDVDGPPGYADDNTDRKESVITTSAPPADLDTSKDEKPSKEPNPRASHQGQDDEDEEKGFKSLPADTGKSGRGN